MVYVDSSNKKISHWERMQLASGRWVLAPVEDDEEEQEDVVYNHINEPPLVGRQIPD